MPKRKLPVLRAADYPPPTTPGGALYVPPMGNQEGRLCRNCAFWVVEGTKCLVHDPKVSITATMVCGYHVHGRPTTTWNASGLNVLQPISPTLSGLAEVGEPGTMCKNCRWFAPFAAVGDQNAGACLRVAKKAVDAGDSWTPVEVAAYGCCAQWEGIA